MPLPAVIWDRVSEKRCLKITMHQTIRNRKRDTYSSLVSWVPVFFSSYLSVLQCSAIGVDSHIGPEAWQFSRQGRIISVLKNMCVYCMYIYTYTGSYMYISVSAHFRFTVVVSLWPSLHKNWKKRWSLESPATMTFTSRSGATGTTGTTVAATGAATVAATGIVLPSVSVLGLRQVFAGFAIAIISSWAEFSVLVGPQT